MRLTHPASHIFGRPMRCLPNKTSQPSRWFGPKNQARSPVYETFAVKHGILLILLAFSCNTWQLMEWNILPSYDHPASLCELRWYVVLEPSFVVVQFLQIPRRYERNLKLKRGPSTGWTWKRRYRLLPTLTHIRFGPSENAVARSPFFNMWTGNISVLISMDTLW